MTNELIKNFVRQSSLCSPKYLTSSAWLGHAPFAFFLTDILKPKIIVELGVHHGFSYFSFCQAVKELKLNSKCYAVDNWKGDLHAGFYDGSVFQTVSKHNLAEYAEFSTLIRSDFDSAISNFEDGSIDLLHIDGCHLYDAVKNDFVSWHPKLSDQAVVLFHDTNVKDQDFGVHQLWEEISSQFPSFTFCHSYGLGMLGVGKQLNQNVIDFFTAGSTPDGAKIIQDFYSTLGASISDNFYKNQELKNTLRAQQERFEEQKTKLGAEKVELILETTKLEADKNELAIQIELTKSTAKQEHEKSLDKITALGFEIEQLSTKSAEFEQTIQEILNSKSWKITSPLRRVASLIK